MEKVSDRIRYEISWCVPRSEVPLLKAFRRNVILLGNGAIVGAHIPVALWSLDARHFWLAAWATLYVVWTLPYLVALARRWDSEAGR